MAKLAQFKAVLDNVRIRGFSQKVRSLANPTEIRDVVSALRFDHLDPKGREMTDIGNYQRRNPGISVRLDRQANTSDGAANLQIQVNNAALGNARVNQSEGTTIAQVLVPLASFQAAVDCPEKNVRVHLENTVRSALLSSYNSMGYQYLIKEE